MTVQTRPATLLALALFVPVAAHPQTAPQQAAGTGDADDQATGEVSVNGDPILKADARGLDAKGEILVVARRIKGQVKADQPPIVTYDEDDIAAYGVSSIADLVAALVPQTGTGRGRGASSPVFLVNGMRISNFREVRGLPPEAIRKVEILPEEVALKFGFRPDQRVVNFVLKDHFKAQFAENEFSVPTRGGFTDDRTEATAVRIEKGARINLTGTFETVSPELEAARGIIQAAPVTPGAPDPADYRTLQARTTTARLNGTVMRPLGGGAGLTLNAQIERDSSDSLNGIKAVDPVAALLSASRTTTGSLGLVLNKPLGRWQLAATLDASHALQDQANDLATSALPERARTVTDSDTALVTIAGSPLALPAGGVSATLKTGLAWQGLAGSDTRTGVLSDIRRADAQAGLSLDVPLTSRKNHVGAGLGDLSLNLNAEAHRLSDFGALYDLGGGLTWAATPRLTLSASFIGTEVAPTLANLAAPRVITPNVVVYDFVRGQSVSATVITGGNPALKRETQGDWKLASNWTLPFGQGNDTLVVEYFRNRSTDPVSAFPAITAAVEAAFAERVTRNAAGQIVAVDETPVTLAATHASRLRFSLNFGGTFGTPDPALAGRQRGFGGGFGGRGGPPGGGGGPPGGGFNGTRGRGGGFGGPPAGDGRGRWNLSLSYSYELANSAQLAADGTTLDLLHGGVLTGNGVARHTVDLDAGGFYRGFGLRFAAAYASATHVSASGLPGDLPLDFGALATVGLRAFIDLGRMPSVVKKHPFLKGARLSLAVNNLFDGQQKVTDSTGAVPLRYQAGYLDPVGRLFRLELRKQF